MKLIPFLLIFSVVYICGALRDNNQPVPSPSPTPVINTTEATPPLSGSPGRLPTPRTLLGGVLNDKAKVLPQPVYPSAARAVRASGVVEVQILIDETGKVVSAAAVSGHPLLRSAAEQAARKAEFEPAILEGQAKKIAGVLNYNFQP